MKATPAVDSTRDQILRIARELIQTRSYLGFSFQDVADTVGIRKASLYHHFATKEALGIAVLQGATDDFKAWTMKRERTPAEWLEAYFRMYRDALQAGSAVCPAGALAPGWDCIEDGLRSAVRQLREAQVLWLTGILGALGALGGARAPAHAWAAAVFATCQGALLAARMTGRVADFDEAIAPLKAGLAG